MVFVDCSSISKNLKSGILRLNFRLHKKDKNITLKLLHCSYSSCFSGTYTGPGLKSRTDKSNLGLSSKGHCRVRKAVINSYLVTFGIVIHADLLPSISYFSKI